MNSSREECDEKSNEVEITNPFVAGAAQKGSKASMVFIIFISYYWWYFEEGDVVL